MKNYFKSDNLLKIKTELFFFSCLASSFVFYPSETAMYLCAFLLPVVFGGKKGFLAGVFAVYLAWFGATYILVTEIKREDGEKTVYRTTKGTLVAAAGYNPGDMLSGVFRKQKYEAEKEGRFARGYLMAEKVEKVRHLPVAGYLLKIREELSDRLFVMSGGKIFLTQALALGDRRYMPDSIRDMYTVTGLGHLLAVSGLHAGLYGGLVFLAFAFLPFKLRMVPVALFMLLLIPFTGFAVTVMRASLLVFAVLTARFFDRKTDVRKLLLFMAGMFILISPSIITDISFILSFSAVYGLVQLGYGGKLSGVYAGLTASAFIMPAAAFVFGMFNVTSVVSTLVLIPVVSAQIICFLAFTVFPSVSLAPVDVLDRLHLDIVRYFAAHTEWFYRLYKPDIYVIFFIVLFLMYVSYRKKALAACVLLLLPYLPQEQAEVAVVTAKDGKTVKIKKQANRGAYFPKMVRSKGFLVVGERVHVFYKGSYGDFKYKFLPFLAEKGIYKADTGSITFYGQEENHLFKIAETGTDYGGVCVNDIAENCKAVYHTKSNTYKCDDEERVHILYNNKKQCRNMYLIKYTGDIAFDEDSYKLR